jgi:short-subunit dehydrogenase
MVQVGIEEDFSTILEMSYESWDLSINRNLTLTFNVTKETLPYMVEKEYGRIVNVSSVTGPVVSNPGESGYSAAKAGLLGMSRALAIEVGDKNIKRSENITNDVDNKGFIRMKEELESMGLVVAYKVFELPKFDVVIAIWEDKNEIPPLYVEVTVSERED